MTKPVIVIGGGGHARVVMDALRLKGISMLGICDPALPRGSAGPFGIAVLGDDEAVAAYAPAQADLVNGVGSIESTQARRRVFETFSRRGYRFAAVVHPAAIVAGDVTLDEGAQIMAGAIIQSGTAVGRDAIVNTGARIDHDCRIGDHVHIAPGATLSGSVSVGEGTHIGVAAAVIQSVRIGRNCLIGAGTVVTRDVADDTRLVTPASRTLPERAGG
jgi:sugar O-acyltransferase (sialic acid O-acetyltransferase NeuD family)